MDAEPIVVICSRGHTPRMRAHRLLIDAGYERWMMVVDDREQSRSAQSMGVDLARIHVTSRPTDIPRQDGIAWTRQWVEETIIRRGEWYVSLDDNVSGWTWLPPPDGLENRIDYDSQTPAEWRKRFRTPMSVDQVICEWRSLIAACEAQRTWAGGFAISPNPFFRTRKWQRLGYVRAQNAVWKNVGLPFYYWRGAMLEDFVRSVDVVARTGSVLINNFVKVHKPEFEEGGIGSFEERLPNLEACCAELMTRYPGLLRPVRGRSYSLTFATRRIEDWRRRNGYLEESR